LVLTSPISPVFSDFPINHSKQATSRPRMMMRSPAWKLSSSGPSASYSSVVSQTPTAVRDIVTSGVEVNKWTGKMTMLHFSAKI